MMHPSSDAAPAEVPLRPSWHRLPVLMLAVAALVAGGSLLNGQVPTANPKVPSPAEYRQFAMQKEGDPARGQKLCTDEQRLGCTKCHTLDGRGLKAGPDLAAAGDQFARRDLIDAVLTPSATIAVGYGTTIVETKVGEEFQGVLKQVTDAWVELMVADGQRIRVATGDIHAQRGSPVSLMPEGLQTGLALQEFADLIEYLVSLKQADHALTRHQGMPEVIPPLAKPVKLRPLLADNLVVNPAPSDGPPLTPLGLVWGGQVPGHTNLFLVAHQAGRIWWIERTSSGTTTGDFADFTRDVFSARGPNGLLGIAFHPKFPENRKYYVKHQVFEAGKIATVLLEREMAADGKKDSGRAPRRLLKIESVAEHHNGGCIEFGPDGFLYLGMGDSAPNFDPQGYGQDLQRLFGKMLRIDVDRRDPGLEYAIPSDNPFVGRKDARPEIWAYGLREPWRFSFDRATGDLWVADLGQERGDEIDLVRRGENFGWNVYEGYELFSKTYLKEGASYVPPIFSTRRNQGNCMIGGQVYHGATSPSFLGVYVFGDHQSKRLWGLTQENRHLKTICQLATSPQSVTAIFPDEAGNLYVVGYQGMVYQMDFAGTQFQARLAGGGKVAQ